MSPGIIFTRVVSWSSLGGGGGGQILIKKLVYGVEFRYLIVASHARLG